MKIEEKTSGKCLARIHRRTTSTKENSSNEFDPLKTRDREKKKKRTQRAVELVAVRSHLDFFSSILNCSNEIIVYHHQRENINTNHRVILSITYSIT